LKNCLTKLKEEVTSQKVSIENYQAKLAAAADELSEADRQRAKLELDCQQRCLQIEREQHKKSETLISRLSQAKDRAEVTVKRLEKEANLHQQAINELKKERNNAYNTLSAHGIALAFSDVKSSSNTDVAQSEITQLKAQNDNLKKVVAQMRQAAEHESSSNPSVYFNQSHIYVKSLEEEIAQLKQQVREKERAAMAAAPATSDLVNSVLSAGDAGVQKVVASLNSDIATLRSEKVSLTAASRKQQIEIEQLKSELHKLEMSPKNIQVELEQCRYELNSVCRHFEHDSASYKQRIGDLEKQLECTREEAAEYHKNLLSMNAENQALSTQLSNLSMLQARSGSAINYGAQELVIQNLQDEVSKLTYMLFIFCLKIL